MWAQHGHIHTSARGTGAHSCHEIFLTLYNLRSLLRLATNIILSLLPVCVLHVHMKAIAHANNWSLTSAFHITFIRAPVNFMWAQAQVCLGIATPLLMHAAAR